MKLVPLEDRVVVKVLEQEEMTRAGIVLPDTAKEKPSKGKVIAVGPGKYYGEGRPAPDAGQKGRHRRLREVRGHRDSSSTAKTTWCCVASDLIGILPEG